MLSKLFILNKKIITVFLTVLSLPILFSCATKPIIDTKGLDMKQYEIDYKECQALADQVETGSNIAKSAIVGAIVGGALGAATGGDANEGAATGAVLGGAGGGGASDEDESKVLRNCLTNRGYKILN